MAANPPFVLKPDTAHMEVPRCDRCVSWDRDAAYYPSQGVCDVLSSLNSHVVKTEESFGCIEFVERRA